MNHGTRSCYTYHRCRCDLCVEANRLYARNRDRHLARVTYGLEQPAPPPYIDATDVRAHILELRQRGVGKRTIATLAEVALTTVDKLSKNPDRLVDPTVAERLLSVTIDDARGRQYVPAGPTWRKVHALRRAGWTKKRIAQEMTGNPNTIALQLGRKRITAANARKVERIYRKHLTDRLELGAP